MSMVINGVTITDEMIKGAQNAQANYGVPASVTIAQIVQESAGKYAGGLSKLGAEYNNLFGIKAGSSWTGNTVTMSTAEYGSNGKYYVNAKFRAYNNVQDSIDDHGKLLSSNRYTQYTSSATNAAEYAKAIHAAGYATDPNYANSLISIINNNNLTALDSGNFGGISTTNTSTKAGLFDGILSNIIKVGAIIVVAVLAAVFFLGAFDIKIPTKG